MKSFQSRLAGTGTQKAAKGPRRSSPVLFVSANTFMACLRCSSSQEPSHIAAVKTSKILPFQSNHQGCGMVLLVYLRLCNNDVRLARSTFQLCDVKATRLHRTVPSFDGSDAVQLGSEGSHTGGVMRRPQVRAVEWGKPFTHSNPCRRSSLGETPLQDAIVKFDQKRRRNDTWRSEDSRWCIRERALGDACFLCVPPS